MKRFLVVGCVLLGTFGAVPFVGFWCAMLWRLFLFGWRVGMVGA